MSASPFSYPIPLNNEPTTWKSYFSWIESNYPESYSIISSLLFFLCFCWFLLLFFLLLFHLLAAIQQGFPFSPHQRRQYRTSQTSRYQIQKSRLCGLKLNHDEHGRGHSQKIGNQSSMKVGFWKGCMGITGRKYRYVGLMGVESQQECQEKSGYDNVSQS